MNSHDKSKVLGFRNKKYRGKTAQRSQMLKVEHFACELHEKKTENFNHQEFQVPKMEGFLNLIRLFRGWVFPCISRIHTAYIGEYLHFGYKTNQILKGLTKGIRGDEAKICQEVFADYLEESSQDLLLVRITPIYKP